jgi:hypothetical protein
MLIRNLLLVCAGCIVWGSAVADSASLAGTESQPMLAVAIALLLKPWLEIHLQ